MKETSELCRSPLNTYNKSYASIYMEKKSSKPILNGDKKVIHKRQSPGDEKVRSEPLSLPDIKSNQRTKQERAPLWKSSESGIGLLQKKFPSADNSPVKRNSFGRSKQSPDDFAKRTEMLTASTLRMVNRLDEINKRKQEEIAQSPCTEGSNSPYVAVINNDIKPVDSKADSIALEETKNVPVTDDHTAKIYSSLTRKNTRQKPDCGNVKKNFIHDSKGQSVNKPSILKKKLTTESFVSSVETRKQKPVSILKRKSLSQDESSSRTHLFSAPPVTFSPSVLENEARSKRQGILKKRRSLDENEVLRRRSYSPDPNSPDFKPILKNQRRSSMEELTRRSKSPDSAPQSILKRKSSREEEIEECNGTEPQGILKRKSYVGCSSGHQHVKISESVILAAAAAVGEIKISENVRPILKKKSSSEEYSTPELSLSEVPRPILKKKTSLDVDDAEDKPKKPILKSSRKTSLEEMEDGKRSRNPSVSSLDMEHVRPILKRENSRPRILDSDSSTEVVVLRRVKTDQKDRPYSSSDIDDELSLILNKRRSLEFQSSNLDVELRRTKSMSSNDRLRCETVRRPLSVAERVINLENFLQIEQQEREKRNTPPGSPSQGLSPSKFSPPSPGAGAVPKFRLGGIVTCSSEGTSCRFLSSEHLPYSSER